jgi:hypothetical protein
MLLFHMSIDRGDCQFETTDMALWFNIMMILHVPDKEQGGHLFVTKIAFD